MFDGRVIFPEYLTDVKFLGCPSDPGYDPQYSFRLERVSAWHEGLTVEEPHADCLDSTSYMYTGWAMTSDREADAWFAALGSHADGAAWLSGTVSPSGGGGAVWRDEDIHLASDGTPGSENGDVLVRLRTVAPLPRTTAGDSGTAAADGVPVMWDQVSTDLGEWSHVPAGANVLYLDGHVAFHRYHAAAAPFPVTPPFAALNAAVQPARGGPDVPWGDCP